MHEVSVLVLLTNIKSDRYRHPPDVRYLNLALTLEYLQEALYQHGLAKYTEDDFKKANLPDWGRQRFSQIASHEQMHVQFLQSAISVSRSEHVKPCEYIFNDDDPRSFVAMTEAVESIATSAYTGLAQFIDSKVLVLHNAFS